MGEGCTACRDICPKNRKLNPIEGFETPRELLHPSLLKIFDMTDEQWEESFATTLMGFFLMDKKYLHRNAAIGLGNFQYVFANYVSEDGQILEGVGVTPDVEIVYTQKALLEGRDPAIESAIEWIRK